MTGPDAPGSVHADLLARDATAFFHQEGSSPCLAALRSLAGPWLEDQDGRRYFDLHGNSVHHLGHAHPELIAALKGQLDELGFSPRRFTNLPAIALAEALLARWPGPPAKVLFATGGSDAIEIALKLARVATRRSESISIDGSYHGHGFGAFGLSARVLDPRLGPFQPGRHHVTPYWRADLGGSEQMLADIAGLLRTRGDHVAALVAEPIRSNCHVPPLGMWPQIKRLCDEAGCLLIFDEIPSGLGKTGRFFAFEHFGTVPDLVVLGKALGGGLLPIAAVIADARLDIAPELNLGHYTHEKNPLTARVALATLVIIARDGLVERAGRLGRFALSRIAALAAQGGPVAVGRGLGLLLAIELDGGRMSPSGAAPGDRMVQACLRHGVSTTTKGPAAIGFSPPLNSDEDEILGALERIDRAAHDLE